MTACGVYLTFTPGGCVLLSAIPYCNEYAAELHKIEPQFKHFYGPIWSGVDGFVREHLSMFAGGYALIALYLLTQTRYRNAGVEPLGFFFIGSVIFGVWCFGGLWASIACREIHNPGGGGALLIHDLGFVGWITGMCAALLTIALGLTLWVGVPLYLLFCLFFILFLLPGVVWAIPRFAVRAPFLLWHYLHYLFVPHPAETAYKEGVARGLPTPEIAAGVADAMYQYDFKDYGGLPPAWVSRNQMRRISEVQKLVEAGDVFMEAVIKNLEVKERLETAELLEELWQNHLKKMRKNHSREKS